MKNWKTTNQDDTSNKAGTPSDKELEAMLNGMITEELREELARLTSPDVVKAMTKQKAEAVEIISKAVEEKKGRTVHERAVQASLYGAAFGVMVLCEAIIQSGEKFEDPDSIARMSIALKGLMDSDVVKETREVIENVKE